jgi:hypothetical protein
MWGKRKLRHRADSQPRGETKPEATEAKSETDLQPKDPREGIDQAEEHNPVNPHGDEIT